ncbi:unnamed protein product [Prorocentrum cordatum]|uniref:Uncharacterized protein n=1 Tax=Prorocentrum cordatum TaxID=2364126 RepID=A0ABN9XSN5_9DINO|nr:unnamed protein product [Polarella glacialis]
MQRKQVAAVAEARKGTAHAGNRDIGGPCSRSVTAWRRANADRAEIEKLKIELAEGGRAFAMVKSGGAGADADGSVPKMQPEIDALQSKKMAAKPPSSQLRMATDRCQALEKKRDKQQSQIDGLRAAQATLAKEVLKAQQHMEAIRIELLGADEQRRCLAAKAPLPKPGDAPSLRAAVAGLDLAVDQVGKMPAELGGGEALAKKVVATLDKLKQFDRTAAESAAQRSAAAAAAAAGQAGQFMLRRPLLLQQTANMWRRLWALLTLTSCALAGGARWAQMDLRASKICEPASGVLPAPKGTKPRRRGPSNRLGHIMSVLCLVCCWMPAGAMPRDGRPLAAAAKPVLQQAAAAAAGVRADPGRGGAALAAPPMAGSLGKARRHCIRFVYLIVDVRFASENLDIVPGLAVETGCWTTPDNAKDYPADIVAGFSGDALCERVQGFLDMGDGKVAAHARGAFASWARLANGAFAGGAARAQRFSRLRERQEVAVDTDRCQPCQQVDDCIDSWQYIWAMHKCTEPDLPADAGDWDNLPDFEVGDIRDVIRSFPTRSERKRPIFLRAPAHREWSVLVHGGAREFNFDCFMGNCLADLFARVGADSMAAARTLEKRQKGQLALVRRKFDFPSRFVQSVAALAEESDSTPPLACALRVIDVQAKGRAMTKSKSKAAIVEHANAPTLGDDAGARGHVENEPSTPARYRGGYFKTVEKLGRAEAEELKPAAKAQPPPKPARHAPTDSSSSDSAGSSSTRMSSKDQASKKDKKTKKVKQSKKSKQEEKDKEGNPCRKDKVSKKHATPSSPDSDSDSKSEDDKALRVKQRKLEQEPMAKHVPKYGITSAKKRLKDVGKAYSEFYNVHDERGECVVATSVEDVGALVEASLEAAALLSKLLSTAKSIVPSGGASCARRRNFSVNDAIAALAALGEDDAAPRFQLRECVDAFTEGVLIQLPLQRENGDAFDWTFPRCCSISRQNVVKLNRDGVTDSLVDHQAGTRPVDVSCSGPAQFDPMTPVAVSQPLSDKFDQLCVASKQMKWRGFLFRAGCAAFVPGAAVEVQARVGVGGQGRSEEYFQGQVGSGRSAGGLGKIGGQVGSAMWVRRSCCLGDCQVFEDLEGLMNFGDALSGGFCLSDPTRASAPTWSSRDELDEIMPDRDKSKPVAGQISPDADESKPVADQSSLDADESKPVADQSSPERDESNPVADESKPVADQSNLDADESKPVANQSNLGADESMTVADDGKPVADQGNVGADESKPNADESMSVAGDRPSKGSYGFHDGLHNILWKSDRATDKNDLIHPGILQLELRTGFLYVFPQRFQHLTYPFEGPGEETQVDRRDRRPQDLAGRALRSASGARLAVGTGGRKS